MEQLDGAIAVDGFKGDIKYLKLLSKVKMEERHRVVADAFANSELEV
jgi:hypothetical protein